MLPKGAATEKIIRKTKKTTKPAFLLRFVFFKAFDGFVVFDENLFMLETVEIFD